MEAKIKAQDDELRKCKEQLAKTKGPAAANIKRRAMDILKRKKMYEGQRDQLMNQQFNIDQTSFAIASVKDTQVTFFLYFSYFHLQFFFNFSNNLYLFFRLLLLL